MKHCLSLMAMLAMSRSESVSRIDFATMWDAECAQSSEHSPSTPSTPTTTADASNVAFCQCTAQTVASGKSYAESQRTFSQCMDGAMGNNAAHWREVAEGYRKKYHFNRYRDDSSTASSASSASASSPVSSSSSSSESLSSETVSTTALESTEMEWFVSTAAEEWSDGLFAVGGSDDHFGAAATYIGFIGVSLLLFFCGWSVKGQLRRWGKGDYSTVNSSYETEADADVSGNPYGANRFDDDWDDNYDLDYASNQSRDDKKGKFWSQYSSI